MEEQKPMLTLEQIMNDLHLIIQAFSVTPQVLQVNAVKFDDPMGREVSLIITMVRTSKVPSIDVASAYGEEMLEAAERYRIFASAPTEKEGLEALMKREAAKNQDKSPDDKAEPAAEGHTVIVGKE